MAPELKHAIEELTGDTVLEPCFSTCTVLKSDLRIVLAALSQAEADRVDAERYRWIENNATSYGGGNGFTLQVFVPHDMEDWGCAIDAARLTKAVKTEG